MLYANVPVQLACDKRLTGTDIRVMIAMLHFIDEKSDLIHVKRIEVSKKCGYIDLTHITKTTTKLTRLGWLKRVANAGRYKPCTYQLTVPGNILTE